MIHKHLCGFVLRREKRILFRCNDDFINKRKRLRKTFYHWLKDKQNSIKKAVELSKMCSIFVSFFIVCVCVVGSGGGGGVNVNFLKFQTRSFTYKVKLLFGNLCVYLFSLMLNYSNFQRQTMRFDNKHCFFSVHRFHLANYCV